MKRKLLKDDLIKHLSEQYGFLVRSSASFDVGYYDESKRLATAIRILVHDTKGNSVSLLNQLGAKDNMGFYDTAAPYSKTNLLPQSGLTIIRATQDGASFIAPLDDSPHPKSWVTFTSWWNRIVFSDNKSHKFTRQNIILASANQDGGAHIDPALSEEYAHLTKDNALDVSYISSKQQYFLPDPQHHAIRQIAFELIKSIDSEFSYLISTRVPSPRR